MKKEILFLKPLFKEMVWGGERLAKEFGYQTPGDHTGECWAISAHAKGDCAILSGTYQGETLSRLWNSHHELFGCIQGENFPLLIKLIDAKADLSIQVHPDDAYAKVHEHGSLGKTECWYVLDCDENATIVIGHHAKNREEMEQMIREKKWKQFIREIPVKKGDFFQIEPGCVHAIKGGTLILETQQNSDITYRVYDYDRLSDGKPRELHIEKSIAVIRAPFEERKAVPAVTETEDWIYTKLVSCAYYEVQKIDIKRQFMIVSMDRFLNVSIIDGTGTLNGIPVQKGTHCIIPAAFGPVKVKGQLSMITSWANNGHVC